MGSLTQGELLDFSSNKLKYLPNSVENLVNLRYLYLKDCELESLPYSIGGLLLLKELYGSRTKISTLPKSMKSLT